MNQTSSAFVSFVLLSSPTSRAMTSDPWRLDPARFPKRIELELSEPVMEHLQQLSLRSGRPLRDLAADLLAQAAGGMQKHQL